MSDRNLIAQELQKIKDKHAITIEEWLARSGGADAIASSVEFLYISHPSGDESVDDLREQLYDYIDSLDEDELRAMSVMFRIQK